MRKWDLGMVIGGLVLLPFSLAFTIIIIVIKIVCFFKTIIGRSDDLKSDCRLEGDIRDLGFGI